MMAQKLRARQRPKTVDVIVDDDKSKDETLQSQIGKFMVQFSILAVIGIIIFYGVRIIYVALFRPIAKPLKTNTLRDDILSDDDTNDDSGIYWTQPVISMDLIPRNLITVSPTDECQNLNQKWNIQKYTEQEALNIVKNDLGLNDDALSILEDPLDLFKYVIMNKNGGFYISKSIQCRGIIDDWIEGYFPIKKIHFNNYLLTYQLMDDDQMNKYLDLDMIIAFESGMPYAFSNWAFFTKPNNPILQFIIDSYLDYIEGSTKNDDDTDKQIKNKMDIYVGPSIFTDAIKGFAETFTNNWHQALSFHKFEDGKAHIITLYLDKEENQQNNNVDTMLEQKSQLLNIMVVPLPELWQLAKQRRGSIMKKGD